MFLIMKKYNEILRDLREDRDLKQKDVAEILEMKQQQYSNYERGLRELPLSHLKTLCAFYNVSADYILGLPNNMPYPER
jgi:transcriptional regulator with XRE-family HTH domain